MNDEARSTVAQGIIAVAVCLGGYMALVEPTRQALAREQGTSKALTQQVHSAEQVRDQVPALADALEQVRAEARRLASVGSIARDERGLYAAVMHAAERTRVAIDQLNPRQARTEATGAGDTAVGYSITATGTYADIAAFVRALQGDMGFTSVKSLTLSAPALGTEQVRASIETAHFSFELGPVKSAQAGVGTGG
jgi:hypothetical protein